ncbi:MAG: hypothetical protein IJS19_02665 [Muribaculaceae bacterium]|nr:hypothetical protein [Muribaculaceae bacterium]
MAALQNYYKYGKQREKGEEGRDRPKQNAAAIGLAEKDVGKYGQSRNTRRDIPGGVEYVEGTSTGNGSETSGIGSGSLSTPRGAVGDINDYAISQGFGSAGTSLRQVASGLRKVYWKKGTTNLDLGGGRFDEGTDYLAKEGVANLIFDPYNRTAEHNKAVAERVRKEGVDTVTCNNVLNVIDDAGARSNVILQAAKALKPDGTAYFTVYEGDKSGVGRQTKADSWQNNRPTRDYIDEVKEHFDDVTLKNGVIIAKSPKATERKSIWDFDGSYTGNSIMFRDGLPAGKYRITRTQVDTERQSHVVYATGERVTEEIPKYEYRIEGMPGTFSRMEDLVAAWREYAHGTIWDLSEDGIEVYGEGNMFDLLTGRNSKRDRERRERWREETREEGRKELDRLAEKLGIDINYVDESDETLSERKRKAKGWYDRRTGRVYVNLNRHSSVNDMVATLLHEAVAHKGLRQLFGKDFDTFLDNVYNNAVTEIRNEINRLAAAKYKGDVRTATEEYLARLAETTDFERWPERMREKIKNFWERIKDWFVGMLRKAGIDIRHTIHDADLRYVLWRSYENMRRGEATGAGVFDVAKDASMRNRFGVGKVAEGREAELSMSAPKSVSNTVVIEKKGDGYEVSGLDEATRVRVFGEEARGKNSISIEADGLNDVLMRFIRSGKRVVIADDAEGAAAARARFAGNEVMEDAGENEGIVAVNRRFNEELQKQIDGTLPRKHVYKLGKPSGALLFAGVEDLPIEMLATTLEAKSSKEYVSNHPFRLEDVKNLPQAINAPIAIFDSETKDGRKVILTELKDTKGNNFVAVLDVVNVGGRNHISINDVISLYPKDSNSRIAKWFDSEFAKITKKGEEPLLKWADTKKASEWLANHTSDVHVVGLSNGRIAKLIQNFESVQTFDEKDADNSVVSDSDEELYRDGDEVEDILSDGSLGFDERITAAAVKMSADNAGDRALRDEAMRAIGGNLTKLRQAMARQRLFDAQTVKRVADLAKILMEGGYLNSLSQYEVKRLLAAVKNSVGRNDIAASVSITGRSTFSPIVRWRLTPTPSPTSKYDFEKSPTNDKVKLSHQKVT